MSAIVPTPQQIQTMSEKGPEGPIVMVNLLKYRAKAAYGPDHAEAKENFSGRDAYQRYGMVALQHVTKRRRQRGVGRAAEDSSWSATMRQ